MEAVTFLQPPGLKYPQQSKGQGQPAKPLGADWLKISEAKGKRTRDDFFPRAALEPDKIVGLDTIVKDAVAFKFTATELTKAQLDDLIKIPPR